MAYTKQTWANDAAGGTPLSAFRMNYMEAGLETAANTADAALATVGAATGAVGTVALDSFTGATDDIKLTAALSYVAAQTYKPAIQLPARAVTFSQTRTPFDGLKIYGPNADGVKGLERAGNVNHKVNLTCGNNANSWWYGTGTYYYINFRDIAFQGNGTSQFWHQPSGSIYATEFHSLDFINMFGVFGNATTKCLVTQLILSGHWATHGHPSGSVQYHFGGSDAQLWMSGYININSPPGSAGGGKPQIWLDYIGKTQVGYTYITCEGDFGGIKLDGSADKSGNAFFGGTFEGRSPSAVSTRPTVEITGGGWSFYGGWFGQVATAAQGTVYQTGGDVTFYSPTYNRADSPVADTLPFLYQTGGGTARVLNPMAARTGELIRVRWKDGTTQTQVALANGMS